MHSIVQTHLFMLHVNQPVYFMEEYIYISRTTLRTNNGQVPVCSQEPVDSTDANIVETLTCLETTQLETTNFIIDRIRLAHVQLCP